VEFDRPIGMMAFVHLKNLLSDRLAVRVEVVYVWKTIFPASFV
jgi:predicted nucleotidyltransferase